MEKFLHNKNNIKVTVIILVLLIASGIYFFKKPNEEILLLNNKDGELERNLEREFEQSNVNQDADNTILENQMIVIDVAGEVKSPSVYIFSKDARVYEAVEAAGGLTESADTRTTNLAAPLVDGTKLYIPSKKDVEDEIKKTGETHGTQYMNETNSGSVNQTENNSSGLVNINRAESTELQKLSGVGPATAEKIITYRNEFGQFKKIEDLMNVSGIGEKTFAKLKSSITVE